MPETSTLELDLGTRALTSTPGSPFVLSAGDIRAIDTYVDDVRLVWDGVVDVRIPAEMKGMVDAADRWSNETIRRVRDMAEAIADYGSRDAPKRYATVADIADALSADPSDVTALSDLADVLDTLATVCGRYAEDTESVLGSVSGFSTAMSTSESYVKVRLAERVDRPPRSWQDLVWKAVANNRSRPDVAVRATQKVWGVWQAFYGDLLEVRDTTLRAMERSAGFLLKVQVDLATRQWKELGDAAWRFRTSI